MEHRDWVSRMLIGLLPSNEALDTFNGVSNHSCGTNGGLSGAYRKSCACRLFLQAHTGFQEWYLLTRQPGASSAGVSHMNCGRAWEAEVDI